MSDLKCPFSGHSGGNKQRIFTGCDRRLVNHAGLQAIAEVYAQNDGQGGFVGDCVDAWGKVMELDRLDRS